MQTELKNKNIIVTGGSDGIGLETARALAGMGASLWIVGRNDAKTGQAVRSIIETTGNEHVGYFISDLSSIHSIMELAQTINNKLDHLDVLVNNAGAFFMKRQTSVDGLEMTFALNHVNYFLLTNLLLDLIKQTGKARIVNVSSEAHFSGHVDFSDLQSEKNFNLMRVYGTSKLMNVLFTYELVRRLNGGGITVNALHPGFVASNFGKSNGGLMIPIFKLVHLGAINTREGAKTSVYLASSPEVEGVTGKYFDKYQAIKSSIESYDEVIAKRLWEETETIIKSRS
jgi:NAD(P)-dependent dehydrogenase (short-subunit alcohol dehydrogenase family)